MRYVIAGSSGLIGTALIALLRADGHDVTRLVRSPARNDDESRWDPENGLVDEDLVTSADVVVNLAGASIGAKRLTAQYAHTVLESRVLTTSLLARTTALAKPKPRFVQASSMGFYGDGIGRKLTERSRPGNTLLSGITQEWEKCVQEATSAGVPVVLLRTGLVLAPTGGFAARLLPLVRMGVLKSLGNGAQWQSWITLHDAVRAIRFLAENDYTGVANVCAPNSVRNEELVRALAAAAGRPSLFRVPAAALRIVQGAAVDDILSSQRGVPGVLTRLGFSWDHPTIAEAAAWDMEQAGHARPATQ